MTLINLSKLELLNMAKVKKAGDYVMTVKNFTNQTVPNIYGY